MKIIRISGLRTKLGNTIQRPKTVTFWVVGGGGGGFLIGLVTGFGFSLV